MKLRSFRFYSLQIFLICVILFLSNCSEKTEPKPTGKPPALSRIPDITVNMTEGELDLSVLTLLEIEYGEDDDVEAYSLSEILEENTEKGSAALSTFSYHQIGKNADGSDYSSRERGDNTDFLWNDIKDGYLLPTKKYRTYFEDKTNNYHVKDIYKIDLYRTIIVVKPNAEKVIFHINILDTEMILNHSGIEEEAIKLTDLITPYITNTPERYEYELTPADDNINEKFNIYSYDEFNDGYFLLTSERVIFPNYPDLNSGSMRFKQIKQIKVFRWDVAL